MMIFKNQTGILLLFLLSIGCSNTEFVTQEALPSETMPPTPIQATATLEVMAKTPPENIVMIYIPAEEFMMGSTDSQIENAIEQCKQYYSPCNRWYYEREGPQHLVSLDAYWIDQTEVSNTQYRLCVKAGVCLAPTICTKGEPTFDDPEKADHPVVCVDWEDAQTYCQWTGGRLPTEAEWEYAFRGTESSIYPWGDEFDGSRVNYCDANCNQSLADGRFDDGYPLTAPVGSYPEGVSWSGAYNMSGNVAEWVADWFGDYSLDAMTNPLGPEGGNEKMLKGCSWFFNPSYCRGAFRPSVNPDTRFDYLGFRCAKSGEGGISMPIEPLIVPQRQHHTISGTVSPGE